MNEAAQRVEHLRLLGRLDDAERVAREALAAVPGDPVLLVVLSTVLYSADRYGEGLAAAEAGCAAAPQAEGAHRMRAILLGALGRHDDAVEAATTAVALAPHDGKAIRSCATVLQRAGRLADAERAARRAVQLDPASAAAHFVLADIAGDRGDLSTARQSYVEALRLDPQHAAARHDLAVLDARAHHPARALRGLIDAGALDPGMPLVLHNVTTVLWRLSWRLRLLLVVSALACMAAAGPDPQTSTWSSRTAAAVALAAMGALTWWTVRDLPRQAWPVVRAALRTDRPLRFTYGAVVVCLLLVVLILVTGIGLFAAAAWVVLGVLGALALVVGFTRRVRRS